MPDLDSLTKQQQHIEGKQTEDSSAPWGTQRGKNQLNQQRIPPSPGRWLVAPLLVLGGRLTGAVSCLCLHQTGWEIPAAILPSSPFRRPVCSRCLPRRHVSPREYTTTAIGPCHRPLRAHHGVTGPEMDAQTGEIPAQRHTRRRARGLARMSGPKPALMNRPGSSALRGGFCFPSLSGPAPEDDTACLGLSSC